MKAVTFIVKVLISVSIPVAVGLLLSASTPILVLGATAGLLAGVFGAVAFDSEGDGSFFEGVADLIAGVIAFALVAVVVVPLVLLVLAIFAWSLAWWQAALIALVALVVFGALLALVGEWASGIFSF